MFIPLVFFLTRSSADCIKDNERVFYNEYQKWVGSEVLVNVYATGIQSELFGNLILPRLTKDGCNEVSQTNNTDDELYMEVMNTLVMVLACICGVLLIIILILIIIIAVMKKKKQQRTMKVVKPVNM